MLGRRAGWITCVRASVAIAFLLGACRRAERDEASPPPSGTSAAKSVTKPRMSPDAVSAPVAPEDPTPYTVCVNLFDTGDTENLSRGRTFYLTFGTHRCLSSTCTHSRATCEVDARDPHAIHVEYSAAPIRDARTMCTGDCGGGSTRCVPNVVLERGHYRIQGRHGELKFRVPGKIPPEGLCARTKGGR